MKRATLVALALGLAASRPAVPLAGEDFSAWRGILAAHPLQDRAGNVVRLGELRGEVVVVSFWASWCKPCKKELRELDGWPAAAARDGLPAPRLVAVSVDADARKAIRFADEAALRLPVYLDGPAGLARSLDLPALPITLVLDREGHVAAVARGERELPALERAMRDLLSDAGPARAPAAAEPGEDRG
jgi:thiol-disulfide isomerase/thioredoxin